MMTERGKIQNILEPTIGNKQEYKKENKTLETRNDGRNIVKCISRTAKRMYHVYVHMDFNRTNQNDIN